jgi:hypothetical protein
VSAQAVEIFLARLYTDEELRHEFLGNAVAVARASGLDETEAAAMAAMDRTGLEMAAESYSRKRHGSRRKC